jgi:hypothetical protein
MVLVDAGPLIALIHATIDTTGVAWRPSSN